MVIVLLYLLFVFQKYPLIIFKRQQKKMNCYKCVPREWLLWKKQCVYWRLAAAAAGKTVLCVSVGVDCSKGSARLFKLVSL